MKETLSTNQVADALRADQYAGWSYEGARALAEYLEEYEEGTGEEMEFDRVALRCDFSEYGSASEAAGEYGWTPEPSEEEDEDTRSEEDEASALKFLQDKTTVIEFGGGVIVQSF